jgi:hypothetical protein
MKSLWLLSMTYMTKNPFVFDPRDLINKPAELPVYI